MNNIEILIAIVIVGGLICLIAKTVGVFTEIIEVVAKVTDFFISLIGLSKTKAQNFNIVADVIIVGFCIYIMEYFKDHNFWIPLIFSIIGLFGVFACISIAFRKKARS